MHNQPNHSTRLMNAYELSAYLGVSQSAAYTLLHCKGFPTVKIGALLYAVRDEVDVWVKRQAAEGGYQYEKETVCR